MNYIAEISSAQLISKYLFFKNVHVTKLCIVEYASSRSCVRMTSFIICHSDNDHEVRDSKWNKDNKKLMINYDDATSYQCSKSKK